MISVGHKIMLTVAVVCAMLFALALFGYRYWQPTEQEGQGLIDFMLASAESQPVELPLCMDAITKERIRVIMYDALDEALKDHIAKMYEVWMKDDRGQPGRAVTGTKQGLKAYLGARVSVDKWDPPPCGN